MTASKKTKTNKEKKRTPGKANGSIDKERARDLYRMMLLIRNFENKSAELYTQEKIRGFLHLYNGEEAVAVGTIPHLSEEDNLVGTYREHAHALTRGISAGSIMAEMYGKQEGCSRGRGGSMHLFDKKTNFYGGNAIVGGGFPLAVGLALGDVMQGKDNITCCFFGEGAVAEGEFHESMNLASLWKLPLIFICENNLYAMGTALGRSEAVTDISRKLDSYNIKADWVDGMDVLAVDKAMTEAVKYVREFRKPYFLEARTYRFRAHSMFDAELYREKKEVEEWKKKDPLVLFYKRMKKQGLLTEKDKEKIAMEVDMIVKEAVEFAEQGTWEPVEDLTRFVYSEPEEGE